LETVPSVHLNVLPVTPSAVDISLVLPLQKLSKRPCACTFEQQKMLIKKKAIPNAILLNDLKLEKLFYLGRYKLFTKITMSIVLFIGRTQKATNYLKVNSL
jgi:hypothetical protein